MTIVRVICKNCQTENILVINKIAEQKEKKEEDSDFSFIGEKIEIFEGDQPKCFKCGNWLNISL